MCGATIMMYSVIQGKFDCRKVVCPSEHNSVNRNICIIW